MKKNLTLALVLSATITQAQYFQNYFNRSVLPASSSNETFYDGIRTKSNYGGNNPQSYFNVGYGATLTTPFGFLTADEARFVRTNKAGNTISANVASKFADISPNWYNAHGQAICEINNGSGTGGYLAVGNVADNNFNGAVVPGGSDGLFYKMNNAGVPSSRFRFDVNGGADYFTDIVASKFTPGTYYVCGYSQNSTGSSEAIVMSVLANGTVNWFRTYQFDPTWAVGSPATARCQANAIVEDMFSGNLMVVGSIRDQGAFNGNDGLVFSLTSAGAVVCAQQHSVFIDDQYQDIIQKANGMFAITGFVGDGNFIPAAFYGIWLTEISPSCAVIASNRYVHQIPGAFNQAKGYSIIERQNAALNYEYYIAGPDFNTAITNSSINKISAMPGNAPVAWYNYAPQSGFVDDGYAIDYAPAVVTKPGLILFSNTNSTLALGPFNSSYMAKTYFNGTTCTNYNPNNILMVGPTPLVISPLPDSVYTTYVKKPLVFMNTTYINGVICTQNAVAGGSNARLNQDVAEISEENTFSIFPNPASDVLNINMNAAVEGSYTVDAIDITGRSTRLANQYFESGEQIVQIKTGTLAKGIYTLQIRNGSVIMIQKFIIQ